MAFPVVESLTPTIFSTAATAHLVAMPATVNAGDLLVTVIDTAGNVTNGAVTKPAAWELLSSTHTGTARLGHYYRIADGTEDGTTVDFVTFATVKAAAQVYRISAWHGTTPPEVGTAATGSSVNPDSPTLTPSWGAEDTLWLAAFGAPLNDTHTVSVYPTSYTNGTLTSTTSTGAASVASARRELNATSDDPSAFTTSSSQTWVAQTVAIRPAVAAVPTAPTNLVATAISTTQIDLAWDDNSADETSFRVERSADGVGSWTTVGTPAANAEAFSNTGLICGTEYFYRVFAVNAGGDSLPSNTDSATTDACPPPAPSTGGNRMGGSGAIRKPPRTGR